jgi:hypothetical protein
MFLKNRLKIFYWVIKKIKYQSSKLPILYFLCFIFMFSVQAEVINYSGDLNTPPDEAAKVKRTNFIGKKKVKGRGARDDDSDDENDWW